MERERERDREIYKIRLNDINILCLITWIREKDDEILKKSKEEKKNIEEITPRSHNIYLFYIIVIVIVIYL